MDKVEKLRGKLDLYLSNHMCTANDTITEFGSLHKASCEELLRLARKYGIDTEEEEWTE